MTLTLGGSTGVPITPASQRLIIKRGDQELSTISVIQPVTPICDTQVVTYQPAALHFIPPKVDSNGAAEGQAQGQDVEEMGLIPSLFGGGGSSGRADADFDGHGPDVKARVRLINNGTSVSAELFMSAKETQSDWTWVQGSRTEQLYIPEPGWRVTNLLVPSVEGGDCPPYSTCFSYVDTNTQPDIFPVGSGPVQRLEFVGDTEGDEAGT
ncbi:MAG: hypothetical protein ACXU86_09645, partial [Archangium sp.]